MVGKIITRGFYLPYCNVVLANIFFLHLNDKVPVFVIITEGGTLV